LAVNGGFAEYCAFSASKLFKFYNLSWEEATLFEASACAIHGLDRIKPPVGVNILLLGAGPTGLCFSQLLKINGGAHVVIASNTGPKMDLARKLKVADEYIEFDRSNPEPQWNEIKTKYPVGFNIVVEATGNTKILERAIDFCCRGGILVFYGVYPLDEKISLSPSRVFLNEITLMGCVSSYTVIKH
jgi:D-arabinitol dehydrogenase (NADP+)